MKKEKVLRSFKPIVDGQSRVLILGSMPGPEALRKRQYYGFEGNQFWTIVPQLFGRERPKSYEERIKLVRSKKIALWDVLASCIRPTALDSHIRSTKLNPIPGLLKRRPHIKSVFINGKFAYNLFMKKYSAKINRPVFYMPSTSPAHAAMNLRQKFNKWKIIRKYL